MEEKTVKGAKIENGSYENGDYKIPSNIEKLVDYYKTNNFNQVIKEGGHLFENLDVFGQTSKEILFILVGKSNFYLNMYDAALYYFYEALKIINVKTMKRYQKKSDVLSYISIIFSEMNFQEMAHQYALEGLMYANELGQDTYMLKANVALCRMYLSKKDVDLAIYYGMKALSYWNHSPSKYAVHLLLYLAVVNIHIKEKVKAKTYYDQAILLAQDIDYPMGLIQGYLFLAKLLEQEGNLDRAIYILNRGMTYANTHQCSTLIVAFYHELAKVYEKKGNYELAFYAYKHGIEQKEACEMIYKKDRVNRLHLQYQLCLLQEEIKPLRQERNHLRKMTKNLKDQANHDPLTHLLNRRGFYEELPNRLIQGNKYYIVLADIDDFKEINDIHGHPCGDMVLRELAQFFLETMDENYMIIRWGGEEFLFFIEEEKYQCVIDKIKEILEKLNKRPFFFDRTELHITLTTGIAPLEDDLEDSIRKADDYLYIGKKNGKNQVIYKR